VEASGEWFLVQKKQRCRGSEEGKAVQVVREREWRCREREKSRGACKEKEEW